MTGVALPAPVEAILPLGKTAAPGGGPPAELTPLYQRSFLDWAVDEALEAGVRRLILVAPQDYAAAPALLAHLRQRFAGTSGPSGNQGPEIRLLRPARCPVEGWDGLVRQAAAGCTGRRVLLIDPLLLLARGSLIVTSTAFLLCRSAPPGATHPVLATARLPWAEALHLPVIGGSPDQPRFRFDRTGRAEMLSAFAGRALLTLPLPEAATAPVPWPQAYRFPGETLVQTLIGQGAQTLETGFDLLDPRTRPDTAHQPDSRAPLRLTVRAGLSAYERPA